MDLRYGYVICLVLPCCSADTHQEAAKGALLSVELVQQVFTELALVLFSYLFPVQSVKLGSTLHISDAVMAVGVALCLQGLGE